MGLAISLHCGIVCGNHNGDSQLLDAIKTGNLTAVSSILGSKQSINCSVNRGLLFRKSTPLHVAAFSGNVDVVNLLLQMGANSNARNSSGQTPLMLACKGGDPFCVQQLLQHNADALAFESTHGRTCLHIACRQGHYVCVVKILDAARNGPISASWGFTRFINVRDHNGAIPLHMAARAGHVEIVRLLLNHGALVSATTCSSTYGPGHGSTPLHFAARSGSLPCVEELLAWGADRAQKDIMGDTAYVVAAHRGYWACAAILNPSAAEPMVWPSPLKFMQELEPETRSTLQAALAQVNKARFNVPSQILSASPNKSMASLLLKKVFCAHFEKTSLYDDQSRDKTQEQPSMRLEDVGSGCFTCCICFENYHKMIEVDACGHQMCAACTMALCCLNKPNPSASPSTPSCPFCRQDIAHLRLAKAPCNKKVTPFPITPDGSSSQPADRRCKSLGRNISFSLKKRSSISFYL